MRDSRPAGLSHCPIIPSVCLPTPQKAGKQWKRSLKLTNQAKVTRACLLLCNKEGFHLLTAPSSANILEELCNYLIKLVTC